MYMHVYYEMMVPQAYGSIYYIMQMRLNFFDTLMF